MEDYELYKGKKLSSLFEDIVTGAESKRNQIDILVSDIRVMIKTPENALMLIPMIKEYMDLGIRNDEQLIKLAAVVQRLLSSRVNPDGESGGFVLSEAEKKQLMEGINEVAKSVKEPIPEKVIVEEPK